MGSRKFHVTQPAMKVSSSSGGRAGSKSKETLSLVVFIVVVVVQMIEAKFTELFRITPHFKGRSYLSTQATCKQNSHIRK